MVKKKEGVEIFNSGFNCAQSVLTPFARKWELDIETLMKMTAGFGAGMGRLQETCGTVTGAYMVLGLKYGSADIEDESKEKVVTLVQVFASRFKAKYGHTNCADLLKINLNTNEGQHQFSQRDLHKNICSKCVSSSIEILEDLIRDHDITS